MDDNVLDFGFVDPAELGIPNEDPNQEQETSNAEKNPPAEDKTNPESVGNGEGQETEGAAQDQNGSPNYISSIAMALKEGGAFQSLDDERIKNLQTAEDFSNAIDEIIEKRYDENIKRINDALNAGVQPSVIAQNEQLLNTLNQITDEFLSKEGDENAENWRKNLIYQDYVNRGYSDERAKKAMQRSIDRGDDIEDAKEALISCKEFYANQYEQLRTEAIERKNEEIKALKKRAEDLKNSIMNDDKSFKELGVTKAIRNKIYDAVAKPVRDKDGNVATELQRYINNNPVDAYKYIGLFYTLTEGFTKLDALLNENTKKATQAANANLDRVLRASASNLSSGNPKITTGVSGDFGLIDLAKEDFFLAPE